MKRGFTLIELLVVIAIIAVLAALLFPVFAQAKTAAKKTVAISNQKQIGTAILLYASDSDDAYPRGDGCKLNSSLNPALNIVAEGTSPSPWCSGSKGYAFRMNHYAWQKWVLPYAKSAPLFEHPARETLDAITTSCPKGQWTQCGQIMGAFALNLSITGATNTWGRSETALGRYRNPWRGGTQTAIPRVSETMLLFELGNPSINFSPVVVTSDNDGQVTQTVYPMAIREFWRANFMRPGDGTCVYTDQPDARATSGGTVVVGFADGSAKALAAGKFLALTPTAAEFGLGTLTADAQCGVSNGVYLPGAPSSSLRLDIEYPLWGLGN